MRRMRIAGPLTLTALALFAAVELVAALPGSATGQKAARTVVASDTAAAVSPIPFWRKIDCQKRSRHRRPASGGDPHRTALGSPQGNVSYRRMTVFDGDDYFGERCELGWNDRRSPVTFYREGRRRITYVSIRLPKNYPLKTSRWQRVLQMKQAAPADNSSGAAVISLGAYAGRWLLFSSKPGYTFKDRVVWSRPARKGVWTRFALNVRYSKKPRKGRIRLFVDLNADGDFADRRERSRRIRTNTLKREIAGTARDGRRAGQSLPSHLRVGIYHDTPIRCRRPRGCSVDVDNVQVIRP